MEDSLSYNYITSCSLEMTCEINMWFVAWLAWIVKNTTRITR